MAELGTHLVGNWWGYHWTRDEDSSTMLVETKWKIEELGNCKLTHVRSGLIYEGAICFEGTQRLVIIMDAVNQIEERGVWRFNRPLNPRSNSLKGGWFGIDYHRELCAGDAILSRDQLPLTKARKQLIGLTGFLARP